MRIRAVAGAALIAVLASGCASVKLYGDQAAEQPVHERTALKDAVHRLGDTPWPQPEGASLFHAVGGMVFGSGDGDRERITEDQAIDVYLETALKESPDAGFIVVERDAQETLRAALQVSLVAEEAAYSFTPRRSDVDLLETAISELRDCREMYVNALKELRDRGEPVDSDRISLMKAQFGQAIRDLGTTADLIVVRAEATEGRASVAERAPNASPLRFTSGS